MEDVLGGRTEPERFDAFLANWEAILVHRVNEAATAFAVDGVCGLVLAGGVGRGQPWPLSDIDLLPIYEDDRDMEARAEIERRRVAMLKRWIDDGWRTGLDIGRLAFTRTEVTRVVAAGNPAAMPLLHDDRWYHSLDKGYQGGPVFDSAGIAAQLARWLTDYRFRPPVVQFRLARSHREVDEAHARLQVCLERQDPLAGAQSVHAAVKWLQTWLLESWGERDASQARFGTRFERLARDRGRAELVDALNTISDLDEASVERRMAMAPAWVWERHDRSWRARRHVGEAVTRFQDARDVLRVCSLYELRRVVRRPFPEWLAVPVDAESLDDKAAHLSALIGGDVFADRNDRPPI